MFRCALGLHCVAEFCKASELVFLELMVSEFCES